MKIKAFILSAGLGERLRPITEELPKPLLPVFGKSILERIIERLSVLKLDGIGINLHYMKDMIEKRLRGKNLLHNITIFYEKNILGTGGGIKNAEEFLKDNIFIVHNGDIISDINLQSLIDEHISNGCIATLAINSEPEYRNIIIDKNGYLSDIRKPSPEEEAFTFTGIAIYSPRIFRYIPDGNSSIINAWLNAIKDGERIKTLDVSKYFWADTGTPLTYAKTLIELLKKNGETLYISPRARIDGEVDGYAVIEGDSVIKKGSCIKDCIILKGEVHGRYEDAIIYGERIIRLQDHSIHGVKKDEPVLIGTGGSQRRYYRIRRNNKTVVEMRCTKDDPDFSRYINYSFFFRRHSIPVAQIISIEEDNKSAILEDLGDMTLYSYLKLRPSIEKIIEIYKKAVDILITMHHHLIRYIDECPLLRERIFDYEHLRWESRYFIERFINDILQIYPENQRELDDEFHKLAMKVDSFPKRVIHRDFQSQNIMLRGKDVFIIDFQGARLGPPSYDIASLLWDPYTRLDDSIREKILNHYIEKMETIDKEFRKDEFLESLIYTKIQRHMQALGAYGFLSSVRGKKYFLKFVPYSMKLLEEDLKDREIEFPSLYELILKGIERLNKTDITEAVTSFINP